LWDTFSLKARLVLNRAVYAAHTSGDGFVTPEHLLQGLLLDSRSAAAELLRRANVAASDLGKDLPLAPVTAGAVEEADSPKLSLSVAASDAIQHAYREAEGLHDKDFIGTDHLLLGLMALADESLATRFARAGLRHDALRVLAATIRQERQATGRAGIYGDMATPEPFQAQSGIHWARFTERGRRALIEAQQYATVRGENFVRPEHLLLAILAQDEGMAHRLLETAGSVPGEIATHLDSILTPGPGRDDRPMRLDETTTRVLQLALDEAEGVGNTFIGPEHLLIGIVVLGSGPSGIVLREFGPSRDVVRQSFDTLRSLPPPAIENAVTASSGGAVLQQAHTPGTSLPDLKPDPAVQRFRFIFWLAFVGMLLFFLRGCH